MGAWVRGVGLGGGGQGGCEQRSEACVKIQNSKKKNWGGGGSGRVGSGRVGSGGGGGGVRVGGGGSGWM